MRAAGVIPEAFCCKGMFFTLATWEKGFILPWREAGPLNHLDDNVDSDQ